MPSSKLRMMKARSCWNFRLPKRYSTSLTPPSPNTDHTCRHSGARATRENLESRDFATGPSGHPGMTPPVDNHCCAALQHGVQTEFFMQDLWRLSAEDIAALIRSKRVSAKEAASAALARLDGVNPSSNAVVDHRPADVLAQADAIDAAIARKEDVGPLAGVPVT